MDQRTKAKVLEIMGYGSIANAQDITELHIARADEENLKFGKSEVAVEEYDDHALHIEEHTRFLLSGEVEGNAKNAAIEHLREHKAALAASLAPNEE